MDNFIAFKKIFDNKGDIGPIADKAVKNFEEKEKHHTNQRERLHYFAVGHTFRQIDIETVFEYVPDQEGRRKIATRYLSLLKENFLFQSDIKKLLNDIRNINAHYLHDFELIKTVEINTALITFITEAFELSCVFSHMRERELTYEEYEKRYTDQEFIKFLCNKFYPDNEYLQDERKQFLSYSKKEAINHLLFIDVTEDTNWKIQEGHIAFAISAGRYLSFHASLFLSAMFLYKHEANKLVSKIKGFKRTDDNERKSKRNIFTFFSKKMASQDLHSEERDLVRFRDMVQYLNHYPVAWNSELELGTANPEMVLALKKHIARTEICRIYSERVENERFIQYSLQRFLSDLHPELVDSEIVFTKEEQKDFDYVINTSPIVKDAEDNIKKIKESKKGKDSDKKIKAEERKIYEYKNKPSGITEKLKKRIETNMLFLSYGRNEDRFMQFALRYLAETQYFGEGAEYKMYKYFDMASQEEGLKNKSNKELDKLKFHQGRNVHYSTYTTHIDKYPDWDMPFVIENNAVQMVMQIDGKRKLFSIQRALLPYLLQDALFGKKSKYENGVSLLAAYCKERDIDQQEAQQLLTTASEPTAAEKSKAKKLLPSRLLQHYNMMPKLQSECDTLERIVERASSEEQRYESLREQAEKYGTLTDFGKRNKGKRFKLIFVRKAWQLMYFSDIYKHHAIQDGHHKRFHITRDEFNDFCRWMYAMDEVPTYKEHLAGMLQSKGFMGNAAFKELYDSSASLQDMYVKTMAAYNIWLQSTNTKREQNEKYSLERYEKILGEVVYINLSHFIAFIEKHELIIRRNDKLKYVAQQNAQYLNEVYYYKAVLPKDEYKMHGKLYDKLKQARFEDALLYEIAQYYLKQSSGSLPKKINVNNILSAEVSHSLKSIGIKVVVPFGKIDKLVQATDTKRIEKIYGYLSNLYQQYKRGSKPPKSLKNACERYEVRKLTLQDIAEVNDHLLNEARNYTRVSLAMERYFVVKYNMVVKNGKNRIEFEEIPDLPFYIKNEDRNDAFHFDVPTTEYAISIKEVERKFLDDIVRPMNKLAYEELPHNERSICSTFIKNAA